MFSENPRGLLPHSSPDLSDNLSREQGLHAFFVANGIANRFKAIKNKNAIFALQPKEETSRQDSQVALDDNIKKVLSALNLSETCKPLTLSELVINIISEADKTESHNTRAGIAVLEALTYQPQFDITSGKIRLQLPTLAIANLFTHLNQSLVTTNNQELYLDINNYLNLLPESLYLLDKGLENRPTLLLNSNRLNHNQIFLAESVLENGCIEIKPFIFALKPTKSPEYCFILDRSTSMSYGNKLENLKKNVIQFAEALFTFDPAASFRLTVFNSVYEEYDSVTKDSLPMLIAQINAIEASRGTDITGVAKMMLDKIRGTQERRNVLLFTDGEDFTKVSDPEETIQNCLSLLTEAQKARNKFFIISYGAQPDHLVKISEVFKSELIIHTSPDLQQALTNQGQLQNWAASRELFTMNTRVISTVDNTRHSSETYMLNQSEQLVLLKTLQARPGDDVVITILDGDGKTILETRKKMPMNTSEHDIVAPSSSAVHSLPNTQAASASSNTNGLPQHGIFSDVRRTVSNGIEAAQERCSMQ